MSDLTRLAADLTTLADSAKQRLAGLREDAGWCRAQAGRFAGGTPPELDTKKARSHLDAAGRALDRAGAALAEFDAEADRYAKSLIGHQARGAAVSGLIGAAMVADLAGNVAPTVGVYGDIVAGREPDITLSEYRDAVSPKLDDLARDPDQTPSQPQSARRPS